MEEIKQKSSPNPVVELQLLSETCELSLIVCQGHFAMCLMQLRGKSEGFSPIPRWGQQTPSPYW